jgi:hypothetical protein
MTNLVQTPTTELEAVNTMLSGADEAEVSTLTNVTTVEVELAVKYLGQVNRAFQSKGWNFNTDYNVTYTRNASNNIVVGSNVLSITSPTQLMALRGTKLYDRNANKNTFVWDRNITDATVVTLIDFEELPSTAREYVTIKAARVFQAKMIGEAQVDVANREDEMNAWATFLNDEARRSKANMGTGTYDMIRMLHRGNNRRY